MWSLEKDPSVEDVEGGGGIGRDPGFNDPPIGLLAYLKYNVTFKSMEYVILMVLLYCNALLFFY